MLLPVICLVVGVIVAAIFECKKKQNTPPGPVAFPIIGCIPQLKSFIRQTGMLKNAWCKLAETYGPVVRLQIGLGDPVILVSGRDAVIEMLNRSEFDGRPDGFVFRHRSGGELRGILFTDGDLWSVHRRFSLRTFKEFGFGKTSMEDTSLNEAISLTKAIEKAAENGPVDNLRDIISVGVVNNLWSLMTGSRFELDRDNPKLMETLSMIEDSVKDSNIFGGVMNQLPFLRHVFPDLIGFTAFDQRQAKISRFFQDEISEQRRTRMEGELRGFIDAYLAEMDKRDQAFTHFDDEQLKHLVKDFFIAAVDTTSKSLGFILAYLAVHQGVQRKVHDEIDNVLGTDNFPSNAVKYRMPYLNAVIAEVLRIANVGPTSILHRTLTDTTFMGYKIKKNYMMLANLMSVHMDKEHWGDPKAFRPERFINDEGQFVDDPWLISFSLGRRRCVGEVLAKTNLFLFSACFLQKFHFSLPADQPELCLDGTDGFVVGPPDTSFVIAKRF